MILQNYQKFNIPSPSRSASSNISLSSSSDIFSPTSLAILLKFLYVILLRLSSSKSLKILKIQSFESLGPQVKKYLPFSHSLQQQIHQNLILPQCLCPFPHKYLQFLASLRPFQKLSQLPSVSEHQFILTLQILNLYFYYRKFQRLISVNSLSLRHAVSYVLILVCFQTWQTCSLCSQSLKFNLIIFTTQANQNNLITKLYSVSNNRQYNFGQTLIFQNELYYSNKKINIIQQSSQMRKFSKKQTLHLPRLSVLESNLSKELNIKNDIFYSKPKMVKVKYSPIVDSNRLRNQCVLVESCLENRDYYDLQEEKKERLITNSLKYDIEQVVDQKLNEQLIGRQAQLNYYHKYKTLDKLILKNQIQNISQNAFTALLQKSQTLEVLPCCLGLIRNKGQSSVLNVSNYKLGDKYVQALSAGLKQAKLIESCNLSKNRITDKGAKDIINQFTQQMIKIDFSHNKISSMQQKLLNLIISNESRLQVLNLQNNKLGDHSIQALCTTTSYSKHLKVLNIRKNMLTAVSGEPIANLIEKTSILQQLYIGTNRIYNNGAEKIINSLTNNNSIRVFDYSLNKIGEGKISCGNAIASCFKTNKTLVHVDFSNNNLSEEESEIIAQGLSTNKKIYGIHFRGNYGYIDSKGFLVLKQKVYTTLHSIMDLQINSYEINFRRQQTSYEPQKFKNVCWICEGWNQHQFRFTVPNDCSDEKKHVYIHFDFQMYEPRLIGMNQKSIKYVTMVPPKKYRYFFTCDNKQHLDPNFQITTYQIPLKYRYQICCQETQIIVSKVNLKKGKAAKIVNNWDQLLVTVLPRTVGLMTKREKVAWSYKDSAWAKQWKLEDNETLKKCFEKDWKNSKICNLVKNQTEQDKIKECLFAHYKTIKQIYRHYSAWSPFGDVWAVSSNAFTQFCNFAKLISKEAPLKIIDLTFITTNSMSGGDWKGNLLVPERGLVRFQFMESLVRLSEQKYKKNGLCDNFLDSINTLLLDHIAPISNNFLIEQWRLSKYFTQQNDILVKTYRQIFTQVYKKNSKLKVKPGERPFMCLSQFKYIIQAVGVTTSGFIIQRDIFVSFNCSMMTQVDELENQRFIKMSEIQFVQAVARIAYILPNSCRVQLALPEPISLQYKFQWLIHEIKSHLCSEDLKLQFPKSQISIFTTISADQNS